MSVLLIRMLKYSGCFCEHSSGDGKKFVNAVVFADDSTLVVTGDTNFEIQHRAQKLLDTVTQFADFAATALNLGNRLLRGVVLDAIKNYMFVSLFEETLCHPCHRVNRFDV